MTTYSIGPMVAASNPILLTLKRGKHPETVHRGCWVLASTDGEVIASAGDPHQTIFARSSLKSLQALALLESTAIDKFGLDLHDVAITLSSHNGEAIHLKAVDSLLTKAGLDRSALRCGEAASRSAPGGVRSRAHHNCSGKHAGFLAATVAMGCDPKSYLEPESEVQQIVRGAVTAITGTRPHKLVVETDGCGAPTFALPLRNLATGIARVTTPRSGLAGSSPERKRACELILEAATEFPELIAGSSPARFDTALVAASRGALFAKQGAEGVQVIGVVGSGVGFAGKVDDGNLRGLLPVAIEVLSAGGVIDEHVHNAVAKWIDPVLRNAADIEIGRVEVTGSLALNHLRHWRQG